MKDLPAQNQACNYAAGRPQGVRQVQLSGGEASYNTNTSNISYAHTYTHVYMYIYIYIYIYICTHTYIINSDSR